MIDYDRLLHAYELSKEIKGKHVVLSIEFYIHLNEVTYTLHWHNEQQNKYQAYDIEDLIKKICEVAEIKAKYKIGQEVWVLTPDFNSKVSYEKITIKEVDIGPEKLYLDDKEEWWTEEQLYSSEDELIDAQMRYWIGAKKTKQENQVCDHESDGLCYTSYPPKYKCKKCGEFYEFATVRLNDCVLADC